METKHYVPQGFTSVLSKDGLLDDPNIWEDSSIAKTHEDLEKDVLHKLETVNYYPLGDSDAMRWSVAWRILMKRQGISFLKTISENTTRLFRVSDDELDGIMVVWFANCMASAPEVLALSHKHTKAFLEGKQIVEVEIPSSIDVNIDEIVENIKTAMTNRNADHASVDDVTDPVGTLLTKIHQWGVDRNIIGGATSQAQLVKLIEEYSEITEGIDLKRVDLIKDGIGDTIVVMVMIAGIENISLTCNDRLALSFDNPESAAVKAIGKIAGGIARSNTSQIESGLQTLMSCLITLANRFTGVTIQDCIQTAYDEIKDRKGRMIDGIFVKEADLPTSSTAHIEGH